MPLYEYICHDCGFKFELLRPFSEADKAATCPHCHKSAKKQLSRFASFTTSEEGVPTPVGGGNTCSSCGASSCDACGM